MEIRPSYDFVLSMVQFSLQIRKYIESGYTKMRTLIISNHADDRKKSTNHIIAHTCILMLR